MPGYSQKAQPYLDAIADGVLPDRPALSIVRSTSKRPPTGRLRPNGGALIALAFVFLGLIGQLELVAVVDGVQTFEWQGRS
jgi:hypothetical protein